MAQVSPKVPSEEREAKVMAFENSGLLLEKVERSKCSWIPAWLYEIYLKI